MCACGKRVTERGGEKGGKGKTFPAAAAVAASASASENFKQIPSNCTLKLTETARGGKRQQETGKAARRQEATAVCVGQVKGTLLCPRSTLHGP